MNFQDVAILTSGVLLGFLVSLNYFLEMRYQSENRGPKLVPTNSTTLEPIANKNTSLADELYESVKILCMVMTYPPNHKKKARHVLATWGKRCNKLLFVTRTLEPDLPTMLLDIPDGRVHLWNKTKGAFESAYKNYLDDADWFLKTDDDAFIVMENVRNLLHSYDSNTSLLLGHKNYVSSIKNYMSGGGYILSKAALKILVEKKLANDEKCWNRPDGMEDRAMSNCLEKDAIFVDTRDELKQQRFFPFGMESHCVKNRFKNRFSYADWYYSTLYYDVPQGSLDCCSSTFILKTSASSPEMYFLNYLIYIVAPFGIDKNINDTLPKKFSFEEIVEAGHAKSFQKHHIF